MDGHAGWYKHNAWRCNPLCEIFAAPNQGKYVNRVRGF
jgi:hypothetical protein